MQSGNAKNANRLLSRLSGFTSNQVQKSDLISPLYAQMHGTEQQRQIIPVMGKGWVEVTQPMGKTELTKAGGLAIRDFSKRLNDRTQAEATALKSALDELRAVQNLNG